MERSTRLFRLVCFLCLLSLVCLGISAPPQETVRFAVIGDSGSGDEPQQRIAQQMVAWHDRLPFGLVLMLGDNIYGSLWRGGNQREFERRFDQPYAELLRRGVVFRAALGNHDMKTRAGRDLVEAWDRFHIGGPQGYYHFIAGEWQRNPNPPQFGTGAEFTPPGAGHPPGQNPAPLVEFFVLTSDRIEKDKQDPEQLAWLTRALAGSRARWRIAYFHHPIYSTGARHGADAKLRAKLEPLLTGRPGEAQGPALPEPPAWVGEGLAPSRVSAEPRVHVVLAGHDHIYQRFHPQQGIVYFVVGSSGQLRRGDARSNPQVAAVNDRTHSFLLVEAGPERLQFWAIDETGRAFDCAALDSDGTVTLVTCPASPGAALDKGNKLE
jgi:hypothetical protein